MKTGEDHTITRDPTLATRTVYSEEYPRVKPRNLYYSVQKDCKNKTHIKPLFCNISIKTVLFGKARYLLWELLVTFWVRLGYCFTPYMRLWLYNGAHLVAFYDAGDTEDVFST